MTSQPPDLLTPAFFLLGLALASLIAALSPRLRTRWHWGRTADSVPVSRVGCSLTSVAFVLMGGALAALSRGAISGSVAILLVLGGFVVFILAGGLDTWRARRM